MITLQSISKKIGNRLLFEDVTISFNEGCRYGLTGPNGSGKSTLLKVMVGLEPATSGQVTLPKRVGFLNQNITQFQEHTPIDCVIMGNMRLWNALSERDAIYLEEITEKKGIRLGELEEIVAEEEGYSAEAAAEELLTGMGLEAKEMRQKMKEIPTDKQFRVLLCQALFGQPQALLLDEPTNHLDLESIGWLENFLLHYQGVLIVISHDRHFLNTITTHIADIDYETIIIYPGNYDSMIVAKTTLREKAEAENKNKEKKVSQLKEFVARFGAGTRASQVQSRIREIQKLQPQELKKSNIQRPYIRFPSPEVPSGKSIFKVDKLSKHFEDKQVIQNLSFEILRGDKVAIIGNNGRGKTTLLKLLAGILAPDEGTITLGHQVQIGYFPQNHSEVVLKEEKLTLFDWLKTKKKGVLDQEIRGVLGKMLFSGDDAFKSIVHLSGGETARLILASLMLQSTNVLLLDEPNNHLDLEAVSAIAWGLEEFKGTVLFASHDRTLVGEVANKIIAFEKEGIHFFEGPLEEYLQRKSK